MYDIQDCETGFYEDYIYNPSISEYEYVGWMYGVLRYVNNDLVYVADSEGISATHFELQAGDTVVWVYGTYTQMQDYFAVYSGD